MRPYLDHISPCFKRGSLLFTTRRGGISLYARVASCAGIPDSQSRASLPDTRFASLVRERMCPGKPDLERGVISRKTLEAPKLLAKVCV